MGFQSCSVSAQLRKIAFPPFAHSPGRARSDRARHFPDPFSSAAARARARLGGARADRTYPRGGPRRSSGAARRARPPPSRHRRPVQRGRTREGGEGGGKGGRGRGGRREERDGRRGGGGKCAPRSGGGGGRDGGGDGGPRRVRAHARVRARRRRGASRARRAAAEVLGARGWWRVRARGGGKGKGVGVGGSAYLSERLGVEHLLQITRACGRGPRRARVAAVSWRDVGAAGKWRSGGAREGMGGRGGDGAGPRRGQR